MSAEAIEQRDALEELRKILPVSSEEEGICTEALRHELVRDVAKATNLESTAVQSQIEVVERLFDSLSLLDRDVLGNGVWRFPSNPAYLCALSVITTLADPDSSYVPEGFWRPKQHPADLDSQRAFLKELEDRRFTNHRSGKPVAIRTVHVAWVFIKLSGRFLMHLREDVRKRSEKGAGDYVFVGGRCNFTDLQKAAPNLSKDLLLRELNSDGSRIVEEALIHTLQRELAEEVGLSDMGSDYSNPKLWERLSPYMQAQGTAPSYAFTTYCISIYLIKLSVAGYVKLKARQHQFAESFTEATADEIVAGRKQSGSDTFFVNALLSGYRGIDGLRNRLESLPDSFIDETRLSGSVVFVIGDDLIQKDNHGNKEEIGRFKAREYRLALLLAGHARGFKFNLPDDETFVLYDHGWIAVQDLSLFAEFVVLARKMSERGYEIIELISEHQLVRMRLSAEDIFFDYKYFKARLWLEKMNKWIWELRREPIELFDGVIIEGDAVEKKPPPRLAKQICEIIAGKAEYDPNIKNRTRKSIGCEYQALGLLRFIVESKTEYGCACDASCVP